MVLEVPPRVVPEESDSEWDEEVVVGGGEEADRGAGLPGSDVREEAGVWIEYLVMGEEAEEDPLFSHAFMERGERGRTAAASVPGGERDAGTLAEGGHDGGEESEVVRVAFWNTGQLHGSCGWASANGAGKANDPDNPSEAALMAATRSKLDWLRGQMEAEGPDILFLFEVNGSRAVWTPLRKWFDGLGYKASLICAKGARKNGVVVAARKATGRMESVSRLAERTVGVEWRAKTGGRRFRAVGLHGFSIESQRDDFDEHDVPIRQCHAEQLRAAREWVDEASGGIIGGDFNRVPCVKWRARQTGGTANGSDTAAAATRLSDDDLRVRDITGWRCSCCVEAGEQPAVCSLIRRAGAEDMNEAPAFTRWRTSAGRFGEASSAIDYVVQSGGEMGRWKQRHVLRCERQDARGAVKAVSDHAYVVVEAKRSRKGGTAEGRPKPLPIDEAREHGEIREAFTNLTVRAGANFCQEVEAAALEVGAGGAASSVWTRALVKAGKDAVLAVEEARRRKHGERSRIQKEGETPWQRVRCWMGRLRKVLGLAAEGRRPSDDDCVGTLGPRWSRRMRACGADWHPVLRIARQKLGKARRDVRAANRTEDEKLLAAARDADNCKDDAAKRMRLVWRALKGRTTNLAMEAIWEGDSPPKPGKEAARRIVRDDPRFIPELGRIGEKFVRQMHDAPAVHAGFEAWNKIFMEEFETLKGSDGGVFSLRREITWPVFQETLKCMPKGKSVGASGFSIELLIAAGEEVQRKFYEALIDDMLEDARGSRVPREWRRIIYVLLEKPAPSNPEVVAERREIALMAQEMKLFLQAVRRVAYRRVTGRILPEQGGWLSGYGAADTSGTAQAVIQQARRLGKPLWLLYIDLATFFPRTDREIVAMAEKLHGLPEEVWSLTKKIYGGPADPGGAVRCQYDSAAGLGAPFNNTAGALMGCVLSPDKAKLLLNTVVVAIAAVCRGFKLWGHDEEGGLDALRARVAQVAFADDWIGMFESEADLRKAWDIWRIWEDISGSKLGVKADLKTVVTGVTFEGGRQQSVVDPKLELRGGGCVPFIAHDAAYKHLGVWRCANGEEARAWAALSAKLQIALQRLRRMHKPSIREFLVASNALLGGLAGYYLQTLYISFEQAEEVERRWRSIYRRKFGTGFLEACSKPRAYYYQPKGGEGVRRKHIWAVGLEAVVTRLDTAAADLDDTPQRAAARSTIALALNRWGCRSDPNRWGWRHLTGALGDELRRSKSRQLGDAWMYAKSLLEDMEDARWTETEAGRSAWARPFWRERRSQWGRWRGEISRKDPLHADREHWRMPGSPLVSEPTAAGGLGLAVEPRLLEAGVVAVGHMCKASDTGGGEEIYEFRRNYEGARRLNVRLPADGAAAAAWTRQIDRLVAAGVPPCAPESVGLHGACAGIAGAWEARAACSSGSRVDAKAVRGMLSTLREEDRGTAHTVDEWEARLRACFPDVQRRAATEWLHGLPDSAARARGARRVLVAGAARCPVVTGGEVRWLQRGRGKPPTGRDGDGGDRTVDASGWLDGHEADAERLLDETTIDGEGYACARSGERLTVEQIGMLTPAVQLWARARRMLPADVECIDEWPAQKKGKTHVNAAVARANRQELAMWQARVAATHAYAVDGTRQSIKTARGGVDYVVARAGVRQDGKVLGGRMEETAGADNYLAELAALIDVLEDAEEGSRVIVVLDATSPPQALLRFQRQVARHRQGYYAASWLDTLDQTIDRHEIVVMLWQTSHVGSPANEAADLAADAAAKAEMVLDVPLRRQRYASLEHSAPQRSVTRWAAAFGSRVVASRLLETVRQAAFHDEDWDMPRAAVSDGVAQVCEAVLAQRSCLGDERRYVGGVRLAAMSGGRCPFGCADGDGEPTAFTWLHAQAVCTQAEIAEEREKWLAVLDEAALAFGNEATRLPHRQLAMVVAGIGVARRGERTLRADEMEAIRRTVGGCVRSERAAAKGAEAKEVLRRLIIAGAEVQAAAHRVTAHIEVAALEEAVHMAKVKRFARRWRVKTREAGPAREAAIREVHESEGRAVAAIQMEFTAWRSAGGRSEEEVEARWEQMVLALRGIVTVGERDGPGSDSTTHRRLRQVRAEFPRAGQKAYWQWKLASMLGAWRRRAALRQRGGQDIGGTVRDEAAEAAYGDGAERGQRFEVHRPRPTEGGGGERRKLVSLPHKDLSMWSATEGLTAKVRRARRAWCLGGGAKAEAARRRMWREAAAREALTKMRTGMKRYMAQVAGPRVPGGARGQAVIGLSGGPLQQVRRAVHIEVAPRPGGKRKGGRTAGEAGNGARKASRGARTAGRGRGGQPGPAVVQVAAPCVLPLARAEHTGWHMTRGRWWHVSESFDLRDITGRRKSNGMEADGVRCGVWLYRVRYVGWPDDLEWWEPAANLCAADVAEYVQRERTQGGTSV